MQVFRIEWILWEYSCVEEYFIEFHKGKILRYSIFTSCTPMKFTWSRFLYDLSKINTKFCLQKSWGCCFQMHTFGLLYELLPSLKGVILWKDFISCKIFLWISPIIYWYLRLHICLVMCILGKISSIFLPIWNTLLRISCCQHNLVDSF